MTPSELLSATEMFLTPDVTVVSGRRTAPGVNQKIEAAGLSHPRGRSADGAGPARGAQLTPELVVPIDKQCTQAAADRSPRLPRPFDRRPPRDSIWHSERVGCLAGVAAQILGKNSSELTVKLRYRQGFGAGWGGRNCCLRSRNARGAMLQDCQPQGVMVGLGRYFRKLLAGIGAFLAEPACR